MTKFIMIDNACGFVWGEAEGADVIAACKALDASLGETERTYEEKSRPDFSNETGYFCYLADDYQMDDRGGDDEGLIAEVSALPLAGYVATSLGEF